jgi:hypothetical protein
MPPCDEPGCPSLAPPGATKCPPHQQGVTASSVAATGRTCVHCKRTLAGADRVRRVDMPARKLGGMVVTGYAHVACPLSRPRRAVAAPTLPFD